MSTVPWNECTPHDRWIGRSFRPIQPADMIALIQLYQPVVGPKAISLYNTLAYQLPLHQAGTTSAQTHLDLMKGLQWPMGELLSARFRLEGVGLWNTYRSEESERRLYTYELVPPLSPLRFFQSDVLSITLFNRVGKERFRRLYQQLVRSSSAEEENGHELTKTFQQVFGSLSPTEIASASEMEETIGWSGTESDTLLDEGKPPAFEREEEDLAMVKARLEPYLAAGAWTEEVEGQIREIRFLYQLDDWDLIKALQNPYVTQNGHIHVNRFRSFVRSQYRMRHGRHPVVVERQQLDRSTVSPLSVQKQAIPSPEVPDQAKGEQSDEEKHFRVLAEISPVELLTAFQKGKQVPRADLELVEDLTQQYELPYGVVNVLLEYVLYSHDFKLPRPLVEKIAGHWARKNIRTVEEAREMARKEWNWEWKKRKNQSGTRRNQSTRSNPQRREREDRLPKSVAEALEQEGGTSPTPSQINPETEARLREKLNQMHQNLSRRIKEKGSS
ncbi:replication initiation and membrane attachment family protein [Desmospora activa]|nr:DnaD domain protein [Desmospora activa]